MDRIARIAAHVQAAPEGLSVPALRPQPTAANFCTKAKSDDDVVICAAIRTPIGRAGKGNLKDTPCEEMLSVLFKAMLERTKIDPKVIEDVQIGNVLQPGAGAAGARMAQFLGGLPIESSVSTVNRQCSSGLTAIANVAASIRTGVIDVGMAGGVESMSMYTKMLPIEEKKLSTKVKEVKLAQDCLTPMGVTSENVAAKWNIPKDKQDQMAVKSHAKAVAAMKAGLFKSEIVPVPTKIVDKKTGKETKVVVSEDEGPREGTTMESLAKLKAVFREGGSTTAGNASQVSDGAALVLLARRSAAKKLNLPIIGRFVSFAVVGVDPLYMGIGPAYAIPVALEKAGIKVPDVDIFEINEAFASQAIMSIEHLKVPYEKVNPKGGAIALGHPLGCTGARQLATLLPELKRQNKKTGVISMCLGTGMGAAAVVESE